MDLSVFLINLDTRPDRLEQALDQMDLFNIKKYYRITGIDKPTNDRYFTRKPVAACWESHRNALLNFLETTSSHALIFEDDFKIKKRSVMTTLKMVCNTDLDFIQIGFLKTTFKERIYIRVENVYDLLVRLYGALERISKGRKVSNKLLVMERNSLPLSFVMTDIRPGAHAYIVNRSCAEYLIQLNSPIFLSTDDLYMALAPMKYIRMARLRKSIVGQSGSTSSINIK